MTSGTLPTPGGGESGDGPLQIELRIRVPDEADCLLATVDGQVTDVTQHLKADHDGTGYGECHVEVTLEDEDGARHEYLQTTVGKNCTCLIFERTDCIPEIRAFESNRMTASLTLPDRSVLREVVEQVRATGATVRLRRVVRGAVDDGYTIQIDAKDITPKQREAIEVAVDEGYYENPRATDLDSLADELDISKSAVSQRLNAVETKLIQLLFSN